jgi:hypothetical protein
MIIIIIITTIIIIIILFRIFHAFSENSHNVA